VICDEGGAVQPQRDRRRKNSKQPSKQAHPHRSLAREIIKLNPVLEGKEAGVLFFGVFLSSPFNPPHLPPSFESFLLDLSVSLSIRYSPYLPASPIIKFLKFSN
jgi:hypothetical protein